MEIAQETLGAVQILAPSGRLDTDSSADFELAVQDLLAADARHFVVDLAGISYVSSAGLRVLLMLGKSVDGKGSLRVAGLNPQVKQVFDIAGFTKLFAMFDDRAAALNGHPQANAPAVARAPTPVPPSRARKPEEPEAKAAPLRVDAPRVEAPRVEAPRVEPPRVEPPRVDVPRSEAPPRRAEASAPEAPKVELPRIEPMATPRLDVPNIEVPVIAEPKLDMPAAPVAPKPREPGLADYAAKIIGAGEAPSDPVDAHAQDTARRAAQLLAANELPAAPRPMKGNKPASIPPAPERAPSPRVSAPPPATPPATPPSVAPADDASAAKKPGFFARLFGKK